MSTTHCATPILEGPSGNTENQCEIIAAEQADVSTDSSFIPPASAALFATDVIIGDYKWKSDLDENGCLSIAILRINEDGPVGADGRPPLTGITLTKSLSERFLAAIGETIFKHQTRMAITVRTENLAADLAGGIGRRGTGKGYFIGQAIDLNP